MLEDLGTTGFEALGPQGLGDFQTPSLTAPDVAAPTGQWGMTADAGSAVGGLSDVPLSFGGAGFDAGTPPSVGSDISAPAAQAIGSPSGGMAGIGSDFVAGGGQSGPDAMIDGDTTTTDLSAQSSGAGPMTKPTTSPAAAKPEGMSQLAKTAIMAAPALGIAGWQAMKGPQVPEQLGQLTGLAGQQATESANLTSQYNAGQIPGGAALGIQNNLRNAISQINQYYSKLGRFNSTDRLKAVQNAQTQSIAQYQQFLDSELKGALAASGQAGQFFAQAAQIQLQADAAFNKALGDAMMGIGKIAGAGLTNSGQKAA